MPASVAKKLVVVEGVSPTGVPSGKSQTGFVSKIHSEETVFAMELYPKMKA